MTAPPDLLPRCRSAGVTAARRTVVDGGVCWKFGLARPEIPYLFTPQEMLRDTQKEFWAVNLDDVCQGAREQK